MLMFNKPCKLLKMSAAAKKALPRESTPNPRLWPLKFNTELLWSATYNEVEETITQWATRAQLMNN